LQGWWAGLEGDGRDRVVSLGLQIAVTSCLRSFRGFQEARRGRPAKERLDAREVTEQK